MIQRKIGIWKEKQIRGKKNKYMEKTELGCKGVNAENTCLSFNPVNIDLNIFFKNIH